MPSATENNGAPPEMSEAQLLAPWHATGMLDDAERRELEELAKRDPEFEALLAEMRQEARETAILNETLGDPSDAVWRRLSRSIDEEKRARFPLRLPAFGLSLKETIFGFLDQLTKPQWQAVAAFAVALCVIQAAAIVYMSRSGTGPFSVASGPKAGAKLGSAFIVAFQDNAPVSEVTKTLDEAGAVIVDGPTPEGLYHLGLRDDTVGERDQIYTKLRSSPAVKLVLREK